MFPYWDHAAFNFILLASCLASYRSFWRYSVRWVSRSLWRHITVSRSLWRHISVSRSLWHHDAIQATWPWPTIPTWPGLRSTVIPEIKIKQKSLETQTHTGTDGQMLPNQLLTLTLKVNGQTSSLWWYSILNEIVHSMSTNSWNNMCIVHQLLKSSLPIYNVLLNGIVEMRKPPQCFCIGMVLISLKLKKEASYITKVIFWNFWQQTISWL